MKKTLLKDNKVFTELYDRLLGDYKADPGVLKTMRAWDTSTERYNLDDLMVGNEFSYFENTEEAQQAIDLMKSAGLETFVLTDTSTALMEEIHYFIASGAKFEGPAVLNVTNKWGEEIEFKGIRFSI